mmetsp:Transcript_19059/g.24703  ORF Transcript_19059/g.24703 Transcript_19059/m.24703 type:complete len:478 (+) Transcript_19059:78-1511(+)
MNFEWPVMASAYKMKQLIGHGAFAKVYVAEIRGDSKRVAIKVMDLDLIAVEITEISKEVQMMRMCAHPNVLCCYSNFVHNSELHLVMPLMEKGSSLHIMHVAKGKGLCDGMAEEWLGYILFQALQGLRYLHSNGQIHRDIKAGNILLDPEGGVALADFGVSSWLVKAGQRQHQAQTFVGTPCWMAPEVMEQIDGYDYKADVWSVGITALELAKGFAPYAYHPPMKVLLLTIQEEPPSLRSYATEKSCTGASFSRSFKEMVRMCLQKEARKRPTVHTLLNTRFFKSNWPVEPLISQLLSRIDDISTTSENDLLSERVFTKEDYQATAITKNLLESSRDSTCFPSPKSYIHQSPISKRSGVLPTGDTENSEGDAGHRYVQSTDTRSKIDKVGTHSGDYVHGTTWTFDDGNEVVLKSESYIRREIDARDAKDDQECAAIFDDLEDLMNQRGGEWEFKKAGDGDYTHEFRLTGEVGIKEVN